MKRHDLKSRRTLSNLNLVTSLCTPNMFVMQNGWDTCKNHFIQYNILPISFGTKPEIDNSSHFCYNCKY